VKVPAKAKSFARMNFRWLHSDLTAPIAKKPTGINRPSLRL
jgi:hypothetical protein